MLARFWADYIFCLMANMVESSQNMIESVFWVAPCVVNVLMFGYLWLAEPFHFCLVDIFKYVSSHAQE